MDNKNKVFVGNVPFQCTKDDFVSCFKQYNGFVDGEIINDTKTNESRGFGFISFKTVNDVNMFLDSNNTVLLKNRQLRFTKYSDSPKNTINPIINKNYLFIKNIPISITSSILKYIFSQYGLVGKCFVCTNINTGEHLGTGVVEMKDIHIYNKLLMVKSLIYNNTQLDIFKWQHTVKIKRNTLPDIRNVAKMLFSNNHNKYSKYLEECYM